MNILIVVIAVAVILFLIFKYQNMHSSLSNIVIFLMILLLFVSVAIVYTSSDVSLATFEDWVKFGKLYFSWVGSIFARAGGMVGYIIKQDWSFNILNATNITS